MDNWQALGSCPLTDTEPLSRQGRWSGDPVRHRDRWLRTIGSDKAKFNIRRCARSKGRANACTFSHRFDAIRVLRGRDRGPLLTGVARGSTRQPHNPERLAAPNRPGLTNSLCDSPWPHVRPQCCATPSWVRDRLCALGRTGGRIGVGDGVVCVRLRIDVPTATRP